VEKGFLGSLLDRSFTSFVTTRVISVLYTLTLIIIGLWYLAGAAVFFSNSGGAGVLWLILFGPLFAFFAALLSRVYFELVIVLFRIFENTRDQLRATRAAWPAAAALDQPPAPPAPPAPAPA